MQPTLPFRRAAEPIDDDYGVTVPVEKQPPIRDSQILEFPHKRARRSTVESPVVAPVSQAPDPHAVYDKIGLGPPKPSLAAKPTKLLVSGYRLLGFAILSLIVFVLVGYVVTTAFYFLSHSWIVPSVVSPSDEKVVALKTELAALQNQRDKTTNELHDAERAIAEEQSFELDFTKAVKADLEGRKLALDRMRSLVGSTVATRHAIHSTNDAYAQSFSARTHAEYEAGMIDRNAMLSGNYQLAQISSSNLSLAERQAEFEARAAELAIQTRSLDTLLAQSGTDALSYDVLKIKRDYDASKLVLARALETRASQLASLARQDEIIHGLEQSAYLRALADHATVALVPYGNFDKIAKQTPLYACKLGMVWCHEVGSVLEVLPGEVQFKHPHDDTIVRGQMIELRLTDPSAAQNNVLFVGGKPLMF